MFFTILHTFSVRSWWMNPSVKAEPTPQSFTIETEISSAVRASVASKLWIGGCRGYGCDCPVLLWFSLVSHGQTAIFSTGRLSLAV